MVELEWGSQVLWGVSGAVQGGRKDVTPSPADWGLSPLFITHVVAGTVSCCCASAQMLAVAAVLFVSTLYHVGPRSTVWLNLNSRGPFAIARIRLHPDDHHQVQEQQEGFLLSWSHNRTFQCLSSCLAGASLLGDYKLLV